MSETVAAAAFAQDDVKPLLHAVSLAQAGPANAMSM